MIQFIKHDLTKTKRGIIPQGVNCQRTMGSGLAKDLYTRWPKVRELYMKVEMARLGFVDWVPVNEFGKPDIYVVNCWTQEYYGREKGKRYASPKAIRKCLIDVFSTAITMKLPIYMPRIGCGLGGLDWETDVRPIVDTLYSRHNMEVYVCDMP